MMSVVLYLIVPCTGKGRLTYADGSFFEGEWQAGLHVKGRFVEGASMCYSPACMLAFHLPPR